MMRFVVYDDSDMTRKKLAAVINPEILSIAS